ncbi:Bax inhibitor-1 family protein [Candidatus Fukatsuia anoeciicola]|uniref:Bax inhibitor-1/YccA family protein n=1 Tax=Candidatus Fukatsuia anoeciicola TaxID=2994492 RepID=UPI0034645091
MEQYPRPNSSIIERINTDIQTYMAKVYGWMSCGLLLTAIIAWYAANTPAIMNLIFSSQITFFGLIIIQLGLVFIISDMINRLSITLATSLFMLYSTLMGLTISSIFVIYTNSSIASTFIITAGMFGTMSFYGYTTKHDLSSLGNMLFMGLIGILLASIVNIWLKSNMLIWVTTYISVLLFVALTAYDTQKLKNMSRQLNTSDQDRFHKYTIVGALMLYLDFINLFLMLLRIFSNRR